MFTMRFDYDDCILDTISKINGDLIEYGLQIELRGGDLDGYEEGRIIETKEELNY